MSFTTAATPTNAAATPTNAAATPTNAAAIPTNAATVPLPGSDRVKEKEAIKPSTLLNPIDDLAMMAMALEEALQSGIGIGICVGAPPPAPLPQLPTSLLPSSLSPAPVAASATAAAAVPPLASKPPATKPPPRPETVGPHLRLDNAGRVLQILFRPCWEQKRDLGKAIHTARLTWELIPRVPSVSNASDVPATSPSVAATATATTTTTTASDLRDPFRWSVNLFASPHEKPKHVTGKHLDSWRIEDSYQSAILFDCTRPELGSRHIESNHRSSFGLTTKVAQKSAMVSWLDRDAASTPNWLRFMHLAAEPRPGIAPHQSRRSRRTRTHDNYPLIWCPRITGTHRVDTDSNFKVYASGFYRLSIGVTDDFNIDQFAIRSYVPYGRADQMQFAHAGAPQTPIQHIPASDFEALLVNPQSMTGHMAWSVLTPSATTQTATTQTATTQTATTQTFETTYIAPAKHVRRATKEPNRDANDTASVAATDGEATLPPSSPPLLVRFPSEETEGDATDGTTTPTPRRTLSHPDLSTDGDDDRAGLDAGHVLLESSEATAAAPSTIPSPLRSPPRSPLRRPRTELGEKDEEREQQARPAKKARISTSAPRSPPLSSSLPSVATSVVARPLV